MVQLILALALVLRLPYLSQSLWLDEAIEALALHGYYGPLLSYSLSDYQPPLYHFLLKGWTALFGYSELALRMPSLLAGVALVYFVIKIAELLSSRRLGLIAGLLTATNPLLIYYSQEGRTYMLTTCLVTASMYYFILCLTQARGKPYLLYALFTTTFLWTSYLSWFVLVAQGTYALRQRRRDLVLIQIGSALTLSAWLPSFLDSLKIGQSTSLNSPEWGKVVGGITGKALALTWVKSAIGRISFAPPWLYGSVVLILMCFHTYIIRHAKKVHPLLMIWLGVLIPAALISFWVPAYSYTRVLFVLPAYLLLFSLGLSHLPRIYSSTALTLNLVFLFIFWLTPRFHREDWRSLTSYLNSRDGAVAMPSLDQSPPLVYYGLSHAIFEPKSGVITPGDPIYYIRYAEDIFDSKHIGQTKLSQAGYTVGSEVSFTGIPLMIYENSH